MAGLQTALGIDVGGTKVLTGLVTSEGHILARSTKPVCRNDYASLVQSILDAARRLSEETGIRPDTAGIAFKGHIDAAGNRILSSSLLGGPVKVDICGDIGAALRLPVFIDNDVNAAALAELSLGAGRTERTFAYINVGTGLAAGFIEDGRLIRGRGNYGGEIGMIPLPPDDQGVRRCLEEIASGGGMRDEIFRLAPFCPESVLLTEAGRAGTGSIFSAYLKDDPLAEQIVNRAADALAEAMLMLEAVNASGLYVFGGGVMQPCFFERLTASLARLSREIHGPFHPEFRLSELGAENVGLLGAASVAFSGLSC